MGRGFSRNTYIRRLLDEDAALPAGDPNKLTTAERVKLITQLPKPRKGNNLPALRKKPVRNERSISPEAEARIKAIGQTKPVEDKSETSLNTFLQTVRREIPKDAKEQI